MGYIYLRTNLINGKHYVGQTVDVERRNNAWNCLKTEYGGYAINNARAKYGADGFSFEILKECPNEDMNYWEKYYIKMYNSKKPYGYNATDGGDSIYEITEETRKKMSIAQRGRKHSEESKKKIGDANRGKKHSAEAVAKSAAAHRGKKLSPEHIEKMSAALRGKYNNKNSKPVQALDKVTGEVIMEFPSTMEAQRQYGFNNTHISACCLGKLKSHKGFIWRWKSV